MAYTKYADAVSAGENGTKKTTTKKYSDTVSIINGTGTAGTGTTGAGTVESGTSASSPSQVTGSYSDAMKIINGTEQAGNSGIQAEQDISADRVGSGVGGNGYYSDAMSIINGTGRAGTGVKDADKIASYSPDTNVDISGGNSNTPTQQTTSYIDSSGNKQTGTVSYESAMSGGGGNSENSVKYTDAVNAINKANAAVESADDSTSINYLNQLLGNLESNYQQQLSSADSASAAATQQAINKIKQQIESLNQQYQATNKQLYTDYMLSRKNLPQQLAALGYTGGLTESSLMGLDTSYGASLSENERNRLTDVSNLESGITDAQLQAIQDLAEQRQSINSDYYSKYAQAMQALQEQKNYEAEQAATDEQTTYERALNSAQVKAQYGDFSGIASIYGADVAAAMKAEYDAGRYAAPVVQTPTYAQVGQAVTAARASGASDSEIIQGLSDYVSDGTLTGEQASQLYGAYVSSRSAR